jgi:hypothetical protein
MSAIRRYRNRGGFRDHVSVGIFLAFLALGAGAIALWFDARFRSLAPASIRAALLHVGAALVIGQLAVPGAMQVVTDETAAALVLTMTFGVAFPGLTYSLLASIWVIRTLQGGLRHR